MTETRLLDFSFSRPTIQEIKASGAIGVLRYLTHSSSEKRLTADEAKTYRDAGLHIGVVFEDGANRAAEGTQAGHDDAVYAAQQAKSIGVPTSCPIFFAVDYDYTPGQVKQYFEGIRNAKISNPIGVYGSASVVDGIMTCGLAGYGWQTVAWSRGAMSSHAHLYQRNNSRQPVTGTDENVLLKPLPLWGAPLEHAQTVSAPKPVTPHYPFPLPAGHVFHEGVKHKALDGVYRYFNMPVPADHSFTHELQVNVGHFMATHRLPGTPGVIDATVWKALLG